MSQTPSQTRRRWIAKKRHWIPLALLGLGLIVAIVAYTNPWPNTLLVRALFTSQGEKTATEMATYAPTSGIDETLNVVYGDAGPDTSLDLFSPSGSTAALPTVIWVHGGAWVSGTKANTDPYVRILASHGYTTVSLNYTVAPEAIYPTALTQLNRALGFLVDHAAEYRIDPNRIVLAGDSAGAQYVAQLATMISSPVYAAKVGIVPTLTKKQVRGVILNCGIYDVTGIPDAPGLGGWGFRIALWAYLGTKDWSNTPGGEQMSTLDDVTADFPTTWISGGNADPLTASQSKPMAKRLTDLGVPVTSLFYPDDTTPALPHEYQFHLDLANAQGALTSTVNWLAQVTK
jgi:acetyl esterase/lipase